MSTINAFDLDTSKRAIEERDASTQLGMYSEDAEVTLADRITQPRSPRVLHGRDEIGTWINDVWGRDMAHRVQRTVRDDAAPPSPKSAVTPTAPTSSARPSWRPTAG